MERGYEEDRRRRSTKKDIWTEVDGVSGRSKILNKMD